MTDQTQQTSRGDQLEDTEAMQRLLEIQVKATAVPQKVVPVKDRNAPDRWYARNDGDIVKLQGSPQAIAHYTGKGFHLLSDDEVRDWEKKGGIRDQVVAIQRKRATLTAAIRRIHAKKPDEVELDETVTPLEHVSIEDLETFLATIRGQVAVAALVMTRETPQAAYQRTLEEAAERELREGVTTGDAGELAGKIERARELQGKRPGGATIPPESL